MAQQRPDPDQKRASKLAQLKARREAAHKAGNKGLADHHDKRIQQLKEN